MRKPLRPAPCSQLPQCRPRPTIATHPATTQTASILNYPWGSRIQGVGEGCTVAWSMKSAACKVRTIGEHGIDICLVMVRTLTDSRAVWWTGSASRAPPPAGGPRYRGATSGRNLHVCMSTQMDSYSMNHPLYANVNPNRIYYNFALDYLATPRRHTGPVAVWNSSYIPPKWNYASRLTCRAALGHYI